MFRKLVMAAVLLGLGVTILWGSRAGNYARTAMKGVKEYADRQIPMEVKFDSARQNIERLGPVARQTEREIAVLQVELEDCQKAVAKLERDLNNKRDQIAKLNQKRLVVPTSSKREAVALEEAVVIFRRLKDTLDVQTKVVAQKERQLEAKQLYLDNLRATAAELQTKLADLETRHQFNQARKAESRSSVDDTVRDSVLKEIEELDRGIRVDEKMIELRGEDKPTRSSELKEMDLDKELQDILGQDKPTNTRSL